MRISLFRNARDNNPTPYECSWEEFVDSFGPHVFLATENLERRKEELPAFSPAEYPEGSRRSKEMVKQVHLLVFDIDDKSEDDLLSFIEQAEGLAMIVCSTWSRGIKPGARARVILPLSRPVRADEWDLFWGLANNFFGAIGDPQCRDANRLYFGCFAPLSTKSEHFYEEYKGEALDVDAILQTPITSLPEPVAELEPVTLDELTAFSKRLSRKADEATAGLGDVLAKVCEGEVFAEVGARDNKIYLLSLQIAKRFPKGDPVMLASHFARSLELMTRADADCPQVDNVEYKIARAQKALRKQVLEKEQAGREALEKRIRTAFYGKRSEPYTPEELESFDNPAWVVKKGGSSYFFVAGSYRGPYTYHDAQNASLTNLSPATHINVWKMSKGEIVLKSITELVAEHGSVAETVELDLRAQVSRFDKDKGVLVEAPCPLRVQDAIFHEDIDAWLGLMARDKKDELLKFLSKLTDLEKPCVALLLSGPKDTGKSLLAQGAARLWTTMGPTTLEEAFSSFNEGLARCPLCFADEVLPKDFRGVTKNGELREHIQATSRPYKRKYLPSCQLIGATRTIIAANNKDILRTQENLSSNDIKAIVDRYLHVPTYEEAAAFLNSIDTRAWVDGDLIAQHCLWLRDNLKWRPKGRFMVPIVDEELSRSMVVQSGPRSAICQWLCCYLKEPDAFHDDARGKMLVQVNKGRLCVNAQGLVRCWGIYVQNERCPSAGALTSALAALSLNGRAKLNDELGQPTNFRIVDVSNLVVWADETGYATTEQIYKALTEDTKRKKSRFLN